MGRLQSYGDNLRLNVILASSFLHISRVKLFSLDCCVLPRARLDYSPALIHLGGCRMNTRRARFAISLLFSAMTLAAVSCGGPPGHYPVRGQVLCNGQPAEGVDVQFNPKGNSGPDPHIPHGMTDENGVFTLECRDGPGALPGEYNVALRVMDYNTAAARKQRDKRVGGVRMKNYPKDALEGRFSSMTNPKFTATINAGNNELPPFEMTVDPKLYKEVFQN
jgi:hypothetical protein